MNKEAENHLVEVIVAYAWAALVFCILAGVLIGWLGQQ